MKKLFYLIINLLFLTSAKAQTLGNYPSAAVVAGRNVTVTPSASPGSAVRVNVTSNRNFQGVMTVNPSSGKVTIVNAKPAGYFPITVEAFSSSGSSTTKSFVLTVKNTNCSQANFSSVSDVHTGLNQLNVVVGDFNSDGKQDIAAAHEGGNNTLSIRLGDGHGGFTGTTEISVGSHPFSVAIGDFDNDGNQDLVIANSGANTVSTLLGNGSGGFSTMAVVTVSQTPVNIAVGDFNNDGKQDFVTANLNGANVSVRLGNGSGGYGALTNISVGSYPYNVAIGDFDNNGNQDLAVANSGSNSVSIRMGNGSGGFTGTTSISVGPYPYGVTIGDFNNDGKQDLATANYIGNSISIRNGDGLGGFSGSTEVPVGSNPYSIALGNFNGDRNEDLATANYFSNSVSVRFGNGNGGFIGNVEFPVGSYPMSLTAGEFNNDSIMDIAVSNFNDASISIRLGTAGISQNDSIISNSPVCEGSEINLRSIIGGTIIWTGPNNFFSTDQNIIIYDCELVDSGFYHVNLIDTANCPASAFTEVKVNPKPVVTFVLPFDTLCSGSPVQTLTGGSPPPGIYSGLGVFNSNLFDPSLVGLGDYFIGYTFTDSNDCSLTIKEKFHVLVCLDVNDPDASGFFNVYPNPVKDEFRIDLPAAAKNNKIALFSTDGKLVREWIAADIINSSFSLVGLDDGIYFLKVFSNTHSGITKIVLSR